MACAQLSSSLPPSTRSSPRSSAGSWPAARTPEAGRCRCAARGSRGVRAGEAARDGHRARRCLRCPARPPAALEPSVHAADTVRQGGALGRACMRRQPPPPTARAVTRRRGRVSLARTVDQGTHAPDGERRAPSYSCTRTSTPASRRCICARACGSGATLGTSASGVTMLRCMPPANLRARGTASGRAHLDTSAGRRYGRQPPARCPLVQQERHCRVPGSPLHR